MPFPPPETALPAHVKAAEEPGLRPPTSILERQEQRLLKAAFNELLIKFEQKYSSERAFRGSEEQLALPLTFLLSTTSDGKRVPNDRLLIIEKFSSLSREEILAKATQQDVVEEIDKLQKQRDILTGKDKITDLQNSIEFLEEELGPQRDLEKRLAKSIERILTDPSSVRELKTPEARAEAVADLNKLLAPLRDQNSDEECRLALRKHELLEATAASIELTKMNEKLITPIDERIASAQKRGQGVKRLCFRDVIRPEETSAFLRSFAKSETAEYSIREARDPRGEVSVASLGFSSLRVGESARSVFLFDKSGIELSYTKGESHYVEHGSPQVIIQEPDFSAFKTPSSQTEPQGDLALLTRAPTATELQGGPLDGDAEIHAAKGALITVGDLRYISIRVFGSPVLDMTSAKLNDDAMVSVRLERGTGSSPVVLQYDRFPEVFVERPLFGNRVAASLSKSRLSLEGVHGLPVELHVRVSRDRVVKIPLTRPGAENAEFNAERAIRARIKAAAEMER